MDILTKVKLDHKNIKFLLQELIDSVKRGNNNHILLEDLLEEIKEHIQAEKVCILELLSKKDKQEVQPSSPIDIDKENIFKILSNKFYEDSINSQDKDLENKLDNLRKLLLEHSKYMESIILLLCNHGISDQESEEFCSKFEQEKRNTLLKSITYA